MKAAIKTIVTAKYEVNFSTETGGIYSVSERKIKAGLPSVNLYPSPSYWEEKKEEAPSLSDPRIVLEYERVKKLYKVPDHIDTVEGRIFSEEEEKKTLKIDMSLAEALSLIDSLEREVASFRKYFREPHNLNNE